MSDDPNVLEPTWEREFPGARGQRVGAPAGARELGATLYELDPGGQAAPYHLHHAQEELLVVLEGTPELRTPEGTRTLAAGAVVAFPKGPDGAHRLRNTGTTACRYLVISSNVYPEVAEYPDTGAVLPMRAPGDGWAFAAGDAVAWIDIVRAALVAEHRD